MNQEQYLQRHKELTELMQAITQRKNADYASAEDPFLNFKLCEKLGICSVETWMLVRICDKFQRIINLQDRPNQVVDEKNTDTALDMANYLLIYIIYLESKGVDITQ